MLLSCQYIGMDTVVERASIIGRFTDVYIVSIIGMDRKVILASMIVRNRGVFIYCSIGIEEASIYPVL
jgi:hypothetical protein